MATGWARQRRTDAQNWLTGVGAPTRPSAWFAALTTTNPGDAGAANVPAGTIEPTSTGTYARQTLAWNTTALPSSDAAANATNSALITFGPSSAAFSTGATALGFIAIYDTATLATVAEANYHGRAAIAGGGFAVNAAGISITFAATTGIVMGMISA
jgi:hypothetical protein